MQDRVRLSDLAPRFDGVRYARLVLDTTDVLQSGQQDGVRIPYESATDGLPLVRLNVLKTGMRVTLHCGFESCTIRQPCSFWIA